MYLPHRFIGAPVSQYINIYLHAKEGSVQDNGEEYQIRLKTEHFLALKITTDGDLARIIHQSLFPTPCWLRI